MKRWSAPEYDIISNKLDLIHKTRTDLGRSATASMAKTWCFPNIEACCLCKNSRLITLIKRDANIHVVMLVDDLESVLTENVMLRDMITVLRGMI